MMRLIRNNNTDWSHFCEKKENEFVEIKNGITACKMVKWRLYMKSGFKRTKKRKSKKIVP